jgi:hypothetical protein
MHGLVLIVLASILASTVHAVVPDIAYTPVRGCTGKLIVEPPFKKGDIE